MSGPGKSFLRGVRGFYSRLPVLGWILGGLIAVLLENPYVFDPILEALGSAELENSLGEMLADLFGLPKIPVLFGFNIMLIASIPFFFIGLAVLHSISAAWPGRSLALAGVYLLLIIALWPAAFVAMLGVLELWLRLRDRAKARRTNKGNK